MKSLSEFITEAALKIDEKKVWSDFAAITGHKVLKADVMTLEYKESKNGVEINWGPKFKSLGHAVYRDAYFEKMGTDRAGFIKWLKSKGVTQAAK